MADQDFDNESPNKPDSQKTTFDNSNKTSPESFNSANEPDFDGNDENQDIDSDDLSRTTADRQVQLNNVWSKIVESLKDDGPRIGAVVQMANPKFLNENIIQLKITVESQKELYQKFDAKILGVLRQKFTNKQLIFEFEIDQNAVESNRPMSIAEQYKEFLNENPSIDTLRKMFDLDIKN